MPTIILTVMLLLILDLWLYLDMSGRCGNILKQKRLPKRRAFSQTNYYEN